jgi:hypothetical protein
MASESAAVLTEKAKENLQKNAELRQSIATRHLKFNLATGQTDRVRNLRYEVLNA